MPFDATAVGDRHLYRLGGLLNVAGGYSWTSKAARGFQPLNCYVVIEPQQVTLIDTGLGIHARQVLSGLQQVVPPVRPLSIFLTRAEYECIGNIPAIYASFPVDNLYAAGSRNAFDAFDQVTAVTGQQDGRAVRLGDIPAGGTVRLARSDQLEVFTPPVRLLRTFWVYDRVNKTLFTSDFFAHLLLSDPNASPLVDAARDDSTLESARDELVAKFIWLGEATKAGALLEAMDAVFDRRDVEVIAPTHGCVLFGREIVARHYQYMRDVLRAIDRRAFANTPSRATSPSAAASPHLAPAPRSTPVADFPREFAPGNFWLGGCADAGHIAIGGEPYHTHVACYLVRGASAAMLIDTGTPWNWPLIERHLDAILGDRPLDWLFPSHAEWPHSVNLPNLMAKYPRARVVGDTRDYDVFFPGCAERLVPRAIGDTIDLGGGWVVEFTEALLKDLPTTLWAYERSQQVLYVADGFAFSHREAIDTSDDGEDGPMHLPAECSALVSEFQTSFRIERAAANIRGSHYSSTYVDPHPTFDALEAFTIQHPIRFIAPAHGNVIDRPEAIVPLIREGHWLLYQGTLPRTEPR